MEALQEIWVRGIEQLFSRPDGPLSFRFMIMPIIASLIALRSGIKYGKEGKGGFIWAMFSQDKATRKRLLGSAVKDIGKMFIVAIVLDAVYQLMIFRAFYIVQALIVAVVCAVVPYTLVRGPVTFITHRVLKKKMDSTEKEHN